MISLLVEIFQMYNAFARRKIIVAISPAAYQVMLALYEQGYTLVVGIIIEAYNKISDDTRRDIVQTAHVRVHLSGLERTFIVVAKLTSDNFFEIDFIT